MLSARSELLEPLRMAHGRGDGPVFLGFFHLVSFASSGTVGLVYPSFPDGALHEDGLADFFDGFGGGRDRKAFSAS